MYGKASESYEKPLPILNQVNTPYWEGCKEGKLLLQTCQDCFGTWFPPSKQCPHCLSTNIEWKPASGRAKLWSWNVFHQPYFKGFKDEIPYVTALVQLEEGPIMPSTVIDISKEELKIDMPLEVVFDKVTEEFTLPKFKPGG